MISRAERSGPGAPGAAQVHPPGAATFEELCEDKFFSKIMADEGQILYSHLSPIAIALQNYNLRCRANNRQLPRHSGKLTDCNFIIRMLYKGI
jgi:hypothetical protein